MPIEVGERLKKLIADSNYTQEQIADYLGINQEQLSKIENGNRNLNLNLLDKISLLYNCSHEYILLESDEYDIPKIIFKNMENFVDLNLVAKMNKIMENLKFLREKIWKNRNLPRGSFSNYYINKYKRDSDNFFLKWIFLEFK